MNNSIICYDKQILMLKTTIYTTFNIYKILDKLYDISTVYNLFKQIIVNTYCIIRLNYLEFKIIFFSKI